MSEESLVFPIGTPHHCKCPDCKSRLLLTLGPFGPFYQCENDNCRVTAKAHADGVPTGEPVPKRVATLRQVAHELLTDLKSRNKWDNNALYKWLEQLDLPSGKFHVSDMDAQDIKELLRLLQKQEGIRIGGRK